MWIREALNPLSVSSPRFLFELCGGRWLVLAAVSWLMVELVREAPAVMAAGTERVVEAVVRKGKRG